MTAKKKNKDLASELIDDILSSDDLYSAEDDDSLMSSDLKSQMTKKESKSGEVPPSLDLESKNETATVRLDESKVLDLPTASMQAEKSVAHTERSLRLSQDKYTVRSNTGIRSATDAHLVQSENLKLAQEKIFELEDEISRLRTDNERLVAAGEALRTENDVLSAEAESKGQKLNTLKETIEQERELFDVSSKAKDRDLKELRMKMSEYEQRLSSNIQKIRVRERELENRLELMRMESSALTRNKDEMLLDLKRQIDHLNMEIDNYRGKSQQLNKQIQEQQDTLRKTVKALRLALTMLEGQVDDEAG